MKKQPAKKVAALAAKNPKKSPKKELPVIELTPRMSYGGRRPNADYVPVRCCPVSMFPSEWAALDAMTLKHRISRGRIIVQMLGLDGRGIRLPGADNPDQIPLPLGGKK